MGCGGDGDDADNHDDDGYDYDNDENANDVDDDDAATALKIAEQADSRFTSYSVRVMLLWQHPKDCHAHTRRVLLKLVPKCVI